MSSGVQNWEVRIKSSGNIVGIHDGHFGGETHPGGTHEPDVRP